MAEDDTDALHADLSRLDAAGAAELDALSEQVASLLGGQVQDEPVPAEAIWQVVAERIGLDDGSA